MNYDNYFATAVERLRDERRYRSSPISSASPAAFRTRSGIRRKAPATS